MFEGLSRSWRLAKASWSVLQADRELIIFPIVSGIASILVLATFALPMIFAGIFDALFLDDGIQPLGWIVGFLFYLAQYFVIFFCNAALVGAALIRLRGGDPSLADGFAIAIEHAGSILGYAMIAATVGMLLRGVRERSNTLGRVIVGMIGMGWSLATFLVVPVLVHEKVGPIEAVKRSMALLRRTWGEQIVGAAGIGAVFTLLMVFLFFLFVPALAFAIASEQLEVVIGTLVAFGALWVLLGLLSSTLSGIYAAAVYRYAADGAIDGAFDAETIRTTFRTA
jgi:hypothetical protein